MHAGQACATATLVARIGVDGERFGVAGSLYTLRVMQQRSPSEFWLQVAGVSEELASLEVQMAIVLGNFGTKHLPEAWCVASKSMWPDWLRGGVDCVIAALSKLDPSGDFANCGTSDGERPSRMVEVIALHDRLADLALVLLLLLLEGAPSAKSLAKTFSSILRYSLAVLPTILSILSPADPLSVSAALAHKMWHAPTRARTVNNALRKIQAHGCIWGSAQLLVRAWPHEGQPLPADLAGRLYVKGGGRSASEALAGISTCPAAVPSPARSAQRDPCQKLSCSLASFWS